jgi:uncharacterized protein
MGDVTTPPRLLVSVAGLAPGAALDAAVALADALDARRVPATLLAGARPHPEVVAWATSRRRVGDVVLLREEAPGRPYRRLPAHEAGLRLTAALRAREALGLAVDGFAAPGWSVSAGTRAALAAAGLGLVLDDAGAHRLGGDGTVAASWRGPVGGPDVRRSRRRAEPALRHLARGVHTDPRLAGALVDDALAAGATPLAAGELVPRRTPRRPAAARCASRW